MPTVVAATGPTGVPMWCSGRSVDAGDGEYTVTVTATLADGWSGGRWSPWTQVDARRHVDGEVAGGVV